MKYEANFLKLDCSRLESVFEWKSRWNVETNTINKICNILGCNVEDIMEHFDDDNLF